MDYCLRTVATSETHKTCWKQTRRDRLDENHKDCGKLMPRLIPPNYVRLFQTALAQVHSAKFKLHFGLFEFDDILHTPIQLLAEREGVAVSAAVATKFQITVFTEDMTCAMDDVDVAGYAQQAQEFQGNGLFKFVLDRAEKHVAGRTRDGKTPSHFASRIAYEQILRPHSRACGKRGRAWKRNRR